MRTSERLLELAAMIYRGEEITMSLIQRRFAVSRATAKRDMHDLQRLPVARWVYHSTGAAALRLVE